MVSRTSFDVPVRRVAFLCAVLVVLTAWALPHTAFAQDAGKRVLLYTGTTGFRHTDAINNGRPVVQTALEAIGFTVDWEDCTNNGTGTTNCNNANKNPRIFTDANLARYDAILLLNASAGPPGPLWDAPQRDAIIKYMQNGGGIAGVHNATDMGTGQLTWDWWDSNSPYSAVGTLMAGHAATSLTNIAQVQVADNNHLSTRDLPATFGFGDEHYNYVRNVRGDHHVLATLDERTYAPGANAKGQDHPITWCKIYDGVNIQDGTTTPKTYRDGRVWVTGMGHFGASYTENGGNNNLIKEIVGGVRWAAGDGRKSDCAATVWSNYTRTVLVSNANQPIGIDVAKDGKVYWSEMGQAGTTGGQWNSTGSIQVYDPKGPANNKTTVVTINTRADHANSEDGVLGMSLQPGFDITDPNKRNIFVYYSPRPGPGDDWPLVSTPARQVVGYNQISRFTVNADGLSADPASERVIIRIPKNKIGGSPSGFPGGPTDSGPGHVGGAGLDFDSAGNLYLGIGDDVSPNANGHNGYAPMDYRSAERWDARKTAANTADLRGKIIRITPQQGDIPAGTAPAADATYAIPDGNLFPVGTAKTRPEIYAMGFRQPFTVHTDPKNPGTIVMGDYCHDNSANGAGRSPAGTCEWNLIDKPGNFGWPFCVGNQSVENTMFKWNYAAGATTGQQYDCTLDQIPSDINYAPDGQTPNPATFQGLDLIPKPTPATIWKKYPNASGGQSVADFGDLTAGGMQPITGPVFRYDAATESGGGFPRYYDGSWLINNRGANDGFWKEVRLRSDTNKMLRVNDWLPYNQAGTGTSSQNSLVIGTQFGADGALYLARYPVTCCRSNVNANSTVQIVKVTFNVYDEVTPPVVNADLVPADPGPGKTYPGPVDVKLSATDPTDAADSEPVSGVDYIEYRTTLNGAPGDWVKVANTSSVPSAFSNTLTYSAQGEYSIEYRTADKAGHVTASKTITFVIYRPATADGQVGATVPSMLSLVLGAPASFGAFTPGIATSYAATMTATVISTWRDAKLTVADPSPTNTGKLMNGTSALATVLQANGGGAFANVGGTTTATTLKTWTAPVTNEATTINFRQAIGATEPLLMGAYSKTLTFTLSTTTP